MIGEYYYPGTYLAVKCTKGGGGTGHGSGDVYPDGWHVVAYKMDGNNPVWSEEVSFYQSGCFTAMITRNIEVIGTAKKEWVITEEPDEKV